MIADRNFTTPINGDWYFSKNDFLEERANPIFYKIGGDAVLEKVVDLFYHKVLADKRISYFFGSNEIKLQRACVKSVLAKALGVRSEQGNFISDYTTPVLKNRMTLEHFVIFINHLRQSFLEQNLDTNLVEEAIVCIILVRKELLNSNCDK